MKKIIIIAAAICVLGCGWNKPPGPEEAQPRTIEDTWWDGVKGWYQENFGWCPS
jgi:hypothetical protein